MNPQARQARGRLVLACSASVVLIMAVQAVVPAMPALQRDLGVSDAAAGWFTTAFVLPGVLLTIPMSVLAARVGVRGAFGVALVVYGVTGLMQPLFASYAPIVALRAVQGVCFAVAMPLTIAIVGTAFSRERQMGALAARQTAIAAGGFALPLIGTTLATVTWRAPVAVEGIAIPIGLAAWAVLPADELRLGKLWRARDLWALAHEAPRSFVVLAIGFARFLFKFVVIAYVPLVVAGRLGASVAVGGLMVTTAAATTGLTATQVPRMLRHLPPSRLLGLAMVLTAAALLGFSRAGSILMTIPCALLFGVSDGILAVLQDAYLVKLWRAQSQPIAASLSLTARNVGKTVGPAAMSVLIAAASLQVGLAALAVVAIALALVFRTLRVLDPRFATAPRTLA